MKNENTSISNHIWSDFCEQIKKIFPGDMLYIYPSEMDIDNLKKIQKKKNIDFSNQHKDENVEAYKDVKDIMERNYYSLYKPSYWKLNIGQDGKISFTQNKGEEFEKFIKKNKLKGVLKILTKFRRINSGITDPNSNLDNDANENKEANDSSFILENLDDPRVLALELNKIPTSLKKINNLKSSEALQSPKPKKKHLRNAAKLYTILKQIEYQAKLFQGAEGDNKEDNDYIIERERTGGWIWRFLRQIGIGGDHYQQISDNNSSNEFNLTELFKRSKVYRQMIRAYIDSADANLSISSIQRKLSRLTILLTKWKELYTSMPTRNDERAHLLKLIFDQIQKLIKFNKVNTKKNLKDLKGEPIDEKSFPLNIDNIRKFLLNWSKLRYTRKTCNSVKNFKLSNIANLGLEVLNIIF